ncbi:hypothetical protein O6H91_14G003600 [Diphasiastrum complanatum]|nr:hypothetical protein O6H91_14G003600 [Diphasiastrum complanatum]
MAAAALMAKQKVASMFSAASGAAMGRVGVREEKNKFGSKGGSGDIMDSVLDNVLAEVSADDVDRERERRRRRAGPGTWGMGIPSNVSLLMQHPAVQSSRCENDTTVPLATVSTIVAPAPVMMEPLAANLPPSNEMVLDAPNEVHVAAHDMNETIPENMLDVVPDIQVTAKNEKDEIKADISEDLFKSPLVGLGTSVSDRPESRMGLNAKVALEVTSGILASAAWQAVRDGNSTTDSKLEICIEEGSLTGCDEVLPLDADGKLPFFLIDAYEEAFGVNVGTVFLFGKVHVGGKYASCCVVVRNMERSIFALPSPSVFPDSTIAELEQATNSGRLTQTGFKAKLQELAKGLKQELVNKMMDLDVSKFRMDPVKRSYAFERLEVPRGVHYYMKLSYPFKDPPLPADLRGQHFSLLFGTHNSALEILLIKKKIKGPCWLSISNASRCPSSSQVSWCKLEVTVDSPKDLIVAIPGKAPQEIPTLVVAALNIKTVINHKQNLNEIASASVVFCKKVKIDAPMPQTEWNTREMLSHFSIVRKLDGGIFPVGFTSEVSLINNKAGSTVLSFESSERAMLNYFITKLHQLDPDVLVGHNISGFDLDILLHRFQACKVQSNMWSKIGRLKRSQMPRLTGGGAIFGSGAGPGIMSCIAGRLLCDTYLSSRELLKEVSYTLTQLSKSLLDRERKELIPSKIPAMFQSSSSLIELVECCETDAWLALGLMFHLSVLPLTRQLTNISGNLWSRTLQGARAQRVEYLLLHEFHSRKFIVPDKLSNFEKEKLRAKRKSDLQQGTKDEDEDLVIDEEDREPKIAGKRKKNASYLGGLVLEPKKGLYDKYILLLDFNSLYPSIIQEYNICFTTVHRPSEGSIPALPGSDSPGVLPQVLKALVDRRKQVKHWLKKTSDLLKYQQLDIQQQALKLTANSMYGCLGFNNSRFYAKPIAELITSQGREILQSTVDLVQNTLNLEVIYGDTDSIMIHTGLDDLMMARSIAGKVIKEVNKKYRLLEIDLDGIFKRMLLLKKKKYAAVKVESIGDGSFREAIEQKGLDIVRRDWSLLSKEIGNFCLQQILSGGSCEDVVESIHTQLRKLQEEMRSGQIDLEKYVITKTLTKSPEDYPDAKNQPHVQVALRRRQSGYRIGCVSGDTVPYVICREQEISGVSTRAIAERARHPDELKNNNGNWMVDVEYYLSQQIHPVVSRLCAPIEGTDAGHIAYCLGLDSSKTTRSNPMDKEEALLSAAAILDDDERYCRCKPLRLVCPQCTNPYQFPGLSTIITESISDKVESKESGSKVPGNTVSPQDTLSIDPLRCHKCLEEGGLARLTPSMLANQVKQRSEEFVASYYDGWMTCDDELCGHTTRNISLRVLGDAERGTICPNYPRCNGHLIRQYTEVDLYKQLTHFYRLLDINHTLSKITEVSVRAAAEKKLSTIRNAVDLAAYTIREMRDHCAFRWVQMGALCISSS